MNKTTSFQTQPFSVTPRTSPSEHDLNKSLSFSPRSAKQYSVSETNCSQLSASKIVTDSEEEFGQEQREEG